PVPHLPLPPSTSSLFPYTTLFRSGIFLFAVGAPSQGSGARRSAIDCVAWHYFIGETDVGTSTAACMVISNGRALARNACQSGSPDRKSTRLNSSHQIISYAVFCLK